VSAAYALDAHDTTTLTTKVTATTTCSISPPADITFDNIAVGNFSAANKTAAIHATCPGVQYELRASAGSSTDFSARTLKNSGASLTYNLHKDSPDGAVWGDGTGPTMVFSSLQGVVAGENYTVVAVLDAGTASKAGTYSDIVTLTLYY
jgi:spore coat protein U-like protein